MLTFSNETISIVTFCYKFAFTNLLKKDRVYYLKKNKGWLFMKN